MMPQAPLQMVLYYTFLFLAEVQYEARGSSTHKKDMTGILFTKYQDPLQ